MRYVIYVKIYQTVLLCVELPSTISLGFYRHYNNKFTFSFSDIHDVAGNVQRLLAVFVADPLVVKKAASDTSQRHGGGLNLQRAT